MSGVSKSEARLIQALYRVERAARRVARYPDDRAPRESLGRALRAVDKARSDLKSEKRARP